MNFDNPLCSKEFMPLNEVSVSMDEDIYRSKAFPYFNITSDMKERMGRLFEELEVNPLLKDIFEKSYEEFHLTLRPTFWWHEFFYKDQKYLFSYFGKDMVSISTQGLTLEISHNLKNSTRWKEAMSLLSGNNHDPIIQKKFDELIESISVDFIKKSKSKFVYNEKGFYLSSFVMVWKRLVKEVYSDFDLFTDFFYDKAKSYLEGLSGKHEVEAQNIKKDDDYSLNWASILNEKKLNRRSIIANKKEPQFRIKKIGGMLRKVRQYYDAEVIKVLYRNHVFSANIANWLSHEDPKVRLYRIQALDSHKVLIPYFKNFNKGNEICSSNECLFFIDSNKAYHHSNFEKVEDVFKSMFTASRVDQVHHEKIPTLSSEELFKKINEGLKSIDEGASVDNWILEVLNECSFISAAPLVYQAELRQLLKIGFRRMKEKSTSFASFTSNSYWNLLRLVEFLLYLGLMDNNYQVKNPKQAKDRLNHIHHNLLNQTLHFILPFHLEHPNKKNRAISLKEYFAMVSTLNEDSWSQSSWGELLISPSLRDVFSWYFKNNIFEGFDFLYKSFLNCFVLNGLFSSLKNWDIKMHEVQDRVERESEQSDANLSWLPVVKQKDGLILNGIEIRELSSNYELKTQGAKEKHCVGGYYWPCIRGESRIFSLEKDGVILSTLEISQRKKHGKWKMSQNYAARNQKASLKSQEAASYLLQMLNSKKESERFNVIPLTPNIQNEHFFDFGEIDRVKQKKLKEEVRKATEKDFVQINQLLSLAEKLFFDFQSELKNKKTLA